MSPCAPTSTEWELPSPVSGTVGFGRSEQRVLVSHCCCSLRFAKGVVLGPVLLSDFRLRPGEGLLRPFPSLTLGLLKGLPFLTASFSSPRSEGGA